MARKLLTAGMLMPGLYFAGLTMAAALNSDFAPLKDAPSVLGAEGVPRAYIFNTTLLGTAALGVAGAVGLAATFRARAPVSGTIAALALFLASAGLAMSGFFPLPNPLHYGFGLSTAGALIPPVGAISLWRAGGGAATPLLLLALFAGIAASVMMQAPPLVAGALMFAAIAVLCSAARGRVTG